MDNSKIIKNRTFLNHNFQKNFMRIRNKRGDYGDSGHRFHNQVLALARSCSLRFACFKVSNGIALVGSSFRAGFQATLSKLSGVKSCTN